ncbi:MAG: hypothetical protein IPF62_10960 [Bacteroidetes bacterium]|nr:hypothetical protein [Bacteroidota bacterium]
MMSGPASSQKPLTYAAVASQLKISWDKLLYIRNSALTDASVLAADQLLKYAGLNIKEKKQKGFTISSHTIVDPDTYITSSVNIYHSLVCYLGLYEKDTFVSNDTFMQVPDRRVDFPLFSYKGADYSFNKQNPPLLSNYKSLERSFLNEGYKQNFGFENQ